MNAPDRLFRWLAKRRLGILEPKLRSAEARLAYLQGIPADERNQYWLASQIAIWAAKVAKLQAKIETIKREAGLV